MQEGVHGVRFRMIGYLNKRSGQISLMLALAAVLRLLVAAEFPKAPETDAETYRVGAVSLVRTGTILQESDTANYGLPFSGQPEFEPLHHFGLGYPAFLSLFYYVAGTQESGTMFARAGTAIMEGLIVPLLALLLYRRLGGAPRREVAVVAAVALWPESILMGQYLLSENLSEILVTGWVLCCTLMLVRKVSFAMAAIAGCVGGFLFLARPDYLPFLAICLVVLAARSASKTRLAIAVAVMIPALLYPSIRSIRLLHEWIPLTSAGGVTLWNASTGTESRMGPYAAEFVAAAAPGSPVRTSANLTRIALARIRSNPAAYAKLCAQRLISTVFVSFGIPPIRSAGALAANATLRLLRILIVVAGLCGCLALVRQNGPSITLVVSGIVVTTVTHVIFWGAPRYFIPWMPVLIVCACFVRLPFTFRTTEASLVD